MSKKKPDWRIKYDQKNPVISVRLTKSLKEILERYKGEGSYAEAVKRIVRRIEYLDQNFYSAAKAEYDKGYEEGVMEGKKERDKELQDTVYVYSGSYWCVIRCVRCGRETRTKRRNLMCDVCNVERR